MFREIMDVYCKNYKEYINILHRHNGEILVLHLEVRMVTVRL